jgi:gas vesicle protein
MKNVNLWIGLGVGLVVGAAAGLYFSSTDEERADYRRRVNETFKNARDKIGKAISDGIEEWGNAGSTPDPAAHNALLRTKAQQL